MRSSASTVAWTAAILTSALGAAILFSVVPGINWPIWVAAASASLILSRLVAVRRVETPLLVLVAWATVLSLGFALTDKPFYALIVVSDAMLLGFLHGIVATGTVPGLPWLMGANIGFDMALADVWLPWLHGQPVVVLETERRTPSALAEAYRLGARVVSLSPTVAAAALR